MSTLPAGSPSRGRRLSRIVPAIVVALMSIAAVGVANRSTQNASAVTLDQYTVLAGENFGSIGIKLGLDANALADANGTTQAAGQPSTIEALRTGRIINLCSCSIATTTTVPPVTGPATTVPATTAPATTVSPTTAPPTTVTATTVPQGSPACGLPTPAFCETFDHAAGSGTQTGDLDPLVWGVSRLGDINPGNILDGVVASHNACGGVVVPPADVRICNGQYVESQNDGGAVTNLASYPKQPFNFTGRTGVIVFDVSADSDGTHAAWPEFVITDEPVPGVRRCISECPGNTPTAKNQIGFSIAGGTSGPGGVTGIDTFFSSSNGTYSTVAATQYGTITKGSATQMNHFKVQVSQSRIDVFGSDAGSVTLKHLAGANLALTFSQGLVWLNDVHYNARKAIEPCECGTQFDHSFTWDNLGFDGPKTYRDWGYDVAYANAPTGSASQHGDSLVNEGYLIGNGPRTLGTSSVDKGVATAAKIVLNAYTFTGTFVSVSVNGHLAVSHPLVNPYHWESFSIVVPLSDVAPGVNTLTFASNSGSTTVANVSIILVAASAVP